MSFKKNDSRSSQTVPLHTPHFAFDKGPRIPPCHALSSRWFGNFSAKCFSTTPKSCEALLFTWRGGRAEMCHEDVCGDVWGCPKWMGARHYLTFGFGWKVLNFGIWGVEVFRAPKIIRWGTLANGVKPHNLGRWWCPFFGASSNPVGRLFVDLLFL